LSNAISQGARAAAEALFKEQTPAGPSPAARGNEGFEGMSAVRH
jgi:hypothetical protein